MNNLDRIDKIERIWTVDVTDADVTIERNNQDERFPCRAILSDTGGEVKVRMFSHEDGKERDVVLSLPAEIWSQVGNVVKVYQNWKTGTAIVSQAYTEEGTLVNGIKLGR